jgi:hypothetical protein
MTIARTSVSWLFCATVALAADRMQAVAPYSILVDSTGSTSIAFDGGGMRYQRDSLTTAYPPLHPKGGVDGPQHHAAPEQTIRSYLDALRHGTLADIAALCADPVAQDLHDLPSIRGAGAPDDFALLGRNTMGRYCIVYCQRIHAGEKRQIVIEYLKRNDEKNGWLFTSDLPINHLFQVLQNCSAWVGQSFPAAMEGDFTAFKRVPLLLGVNPEVSHWTKPVDAAAALLTPAEPDCHVLARIGPGWPHPIEDERTPSPVGSALKQLRSAFATEDLQRIDALWSRSPENPVPAEFLGWRSDLKAKTWVVGVLGHPQGEVYLLESYREAVPGQGVEVAPGQDPPAEPKRHYGALFWARGTFVSALQPEDTFSDVNQLMAKPDFWQALAKACAREK